MAQNCIAAPLRLSLRTVAPLLALAIAAASSTAAEAPDTVAPLEALGAAPIPIGRLPSSPHLTMSPVRSSKTPTQRREFRIRLQSGFIIDPKLGEPALPEALRGFRGAENAARTYLLHYGDSDPEVAHARVREAGGRVVAYVPEHTLVVRLEPSSELALDAQAAWVGLYQPAYKLSPRLALESVAAGPIDVLLFPDGDLERVSAWIRDAGGTVLLSSAEGVNKILRLELPHATVPALAQDSDVAWIEPYVRPEASNGDAQWVAQTGKLNDRRLWDLGITGAGEIVMSSDTGLDTAHDQFRDPALPIGGFGDFPAHRKLIAYQLGSAGAAARFGDHGSYHGTHTAGTVAGDDGPVAAASQDGVAKSARLYFMDLAGPIHGNGVEPFADLNRLFLPSYKGNAGGAARISSNSWGSPVRGDYDLAALAVDQFMWSHPDYLILFATGNAGNTGTVGSPATAKNAIGVGGVGNGASSDLIFAPTSRGPTADGRRKPTICAPAQLVSATAAPNHYAGYSGTSMATPVAAGTVAMMRQYCTQGWYPTGAPVAANRFVPSAALLKAMCVNAGTDVTGFQAPDHNIGYGRLSADNVLYFPGDPERLLLADFNAGLGHRQWVEYQVQVSDANVPLGVSLCWTDHPGNPAAAIQLVNDLDLTVTIGRETYRGNVYSGGFSVTGGRSDTLNVEEAVKIASPATGIWTIRIEGANVPVGPQPFGLCITGGIGVGAGTLSLDRVSYGSAGIVELRVTDSNAGSEATVAVRSSTEPGGERVTLRGAGAVLSGTLQLSPFAGSAGDGVLQVSNGDAIMAAYEDIAPPATITASARVLFNSPQISTVAAARHGHGAALISWRSDQNARSRVIYGVAPGALESSVLDPAAVLEHRVVISGLEVGRTYFFDVESEDLNGNLTRDDNGGAHYRFTAEPAADLLLVLGAGEFERTARYEEALRALGWSYDIWRGPEAESPEVGDATHGLRSYRVVWWQVGPESYPPFTNAARDALSRFLEGGGRLAVVGHDIARAFGDPGSPYGNAERKAWLEGTLHSVYRSQPASWSGVRGILADPISGAYLDGILYREHRLGASGDEVALALGDGHGSAVWLSGDLTPQACGIRWESNGARGRAGESFWAGTPSRLMALYFEWSGLDPGLESSRERTDILHRSLSWLLGRQRPSVTLLSPNDGSVVTADSLVIRWTESVDPDVAIGGRRVEYSADGGQSWITIDGDAGPSPLRWDLRAVPNTSDARVRIRLTDGGTPVLAGSDQSDRRFAIRRPGGDALGPVVLPGSLRVHPNPIRNQERLQIVATISDVTAGAGNVAAAEWSFGDQPAPPGSGHGLQGSYSGTTATVLATLQSASFPPGRHQLFVRGRDQAGNWGEAAALPVVVNGTRPLDADSAPRIFELGLTAPNPVLDRTEIPFAVPQTAEVTLAIYDIQGRRVRGLVQGQVAAGPHRVTWDRTDEGGRHVGSGIYYYRLWAGGRSLQRRLVVLR